MLRRSFVSRYTPFGTNNKFNRDGYSHSILPNGLQVLSLKDTATTSTVSLFSRCGTRYENDSNAGVSAVLETLPFKGNKLLPQPSFSQELIAISAALRVNNVREIFSWTVTVPRFSYEDAIDCLHGISMHPAATQDDFESAKSDAVQKLMYADRDPTRLCFDYLHDVCYGGKAVGRTQLITPEQLQSITLEQCEKFLADCVTPTRSVVVGLGIDDHAAFAQRVADTFRWPQKSSSSSSAGAPVVFDSDIGFTGGTKKVFNNQAPETLSKFEEKNLTHIALAFKGVDHNHPDYYVYSVAQALLGGGMSFSSGGPGKGMHTKLFREVSAKEGWVNSIECLTAWYSNVGFFGFYGTAPHEFAAAMLNIMMFQAASVAERVTESHLEMARNQFMSQLVLLTDARDVASDEVGKNLLLHDSLITPRELMEGAEKVTLADVRRCMGEMLQHKPALAVYGNSKELPDAEEVWKRVKVMHAAEKNRGSRLGR